MSPLATIGLVLLVLVGALLWWVAIAFASAENLTDSEPYPHEIGDGEVKWRGPAWSDEA